MRRRDRAFGASGGAAGGDEGGEEGGAGARRRHEKKIAAFGVAFLAALTVALVPLAVAGLPRTGAQPAALLPRGARRATMAP